LSKVCRFEATK